MARQKEKAAQSQGVKGSKTLHLDEIALKKGQGQFETVIATEHRVIETMPGRKSQTLQAVLQGIEGMSEIKYACIDMCASFAAAVREALPQAEIVIDRFHIIQHLNDTLERLRKRTHRELDVPKRKRFGQIRFVLGQSYFSLGKDDRRLVKEYLRLNPELKQVYWLCQEFRQILWSKTQCRQTVSNQLMRWVERSQKYLRRFVKTLQSWWNEIVNACLFPQNNGRAEGLNHKIKLVKRMGYGYRNRLSFKYRILAACNP